MGDHPSESDDYVAYIAGPTANGFAYGLTWEQWDELQARESKIEQARTARRARGHSVPVDMRGMLAAWREPCWSERLHLLDVDTGEIVTMEDEPAEWHAARAHAISSDPVRFEQIPRQLDRHTRLTLRRELASSVADPKLRQRLLGALRARRRKFARFHEIIAGAGQLADELSRRIAVAEDHAITTEALDWLAQIGVTPASRPAERSQGEPAASSAMSAM